MFFVFLFFFAASVFIEGVSLPPCKAFCMRPEQWQSKYEELQRHHATVVKHWRAMYRYKAAHAAGVAKFDQDTIEKLEHDKQTLLVKLERLHAIEIKNTQARVNIACELASYKLRNMR